MTRLAIGSYTAVSGGTGSGVTILERTRDGRAWHVAQVLECDDPSFLALTDGTLHAVAETTPGRVFSWRTGDAGFVPGATAASGGASPCHLAVDPVSGALVVAAYVGGTVGVLSADAGDPHRVTRTIALPDGTGPVADRQEAPHAHQVVPTPWGTVLVADLGADRLHEVRVDPGSLVPGLVASHRLPAGSGPRHLAFLDDLVVVAGELDGRVHVLRREGEDLVLDHSVDAHEGDGGPPAVLLSHLAVHRDRVYVATRGRDTVSVLERGPGDGRLVLVAEVPCGGAWPRHFAIVDEALVCANQGSGTVTVAPLDTATGVPGPVVETVELGSPACVLPL